MDAGESGRDTRVEWGQAGWQPMGSGGKGAGGGQGRASGWTWGESKPARQSELDTFARITGRVRQADALATP